MKWRENGLGLLQGYLVEGNERELRIHIWSPTLEREGIRRSGNVHDHRFDMTSRVLVGGISHAWTRPEESPMLLGGWRMCKVVHARKVHAASGSFDCDVEELPGRWFADFHRIKIRAGSIYTFPRFEFHESFSDELTITIVEKRNQDPTVSAKILWPDALPLTHAFGGHPSGMMAAVVENARDALLAKWETLR